MDSNRDDAQRCLDVAAAALAEGDLDKASRLLEKSRRMYPSLSDSQDRLSAAIDLARASRSSGASSSSSALNNRSDAPEQNGQADPTPEDDAKKATPQMKTAVQRVTKLRSKSHYEVLGIERDADESAIKKAYRKLALQLHPDRNLATGADEAFKRVNAAFVILSDKSKREHYDQFGTDPDTPAGQSASQFAQGASVFTNGGVPLDELFRAGGMGQGMAADDLFEALFSGGGGGTTFHFSSNGVRFRTGRPARRRPRRANNNSADDDSYDNDNNRQQNDHGMYEDEGLGGFFQRLKPFLYLFLFMFISYVLSDDSTSSYGRSQPSYSLHRSNYYTFSRTTMNGVPFFTHTDKPMGKRDERRLWHSIDRQALSQFHVACEQEHQTQQELEYRSRSWLVGQKARDKYKKQLENYDKPHCTEYQRLLQSIRRNGR